MDKVGIRWLEPDTHIGKTSFVKLKNVNLKSSKVMPAGTVIKARWKSTNKAYRAVLLNNIKAKSNNKEMSSPSMQDHSSPRSVLNNPAGLMDTVKKEKTENFNLELKDGEWSLKQLEAKIDKLEEKVSAVSSSVDEMKNTLKGELERLRVVLIGGQWGIVQQLQRIEMGMSKSHYEAQETQKLIQAQTERIKSDLVQKDTSDVIPSTENHKRMQPVIGLIENGCVMAQHKELKVPLVPFEHYRKMLENSKTPTSFLRKLMRITFTNDELAKSNYSGGTVMSLNGMIVKKSLDHGRLLALFSQVELEFPLATTGDNFAKMRDTVNEECRRLASKFRLREDSKKNVI